MEYSHFFASSLSWCKWRFFSAGVRRSWLRPLFWIFFPALWTVHGALRQFVTNLVRQHSLGAIYKSEFSSKRATRNDTGLKFVDYICNSRDQRFFLSISLFGSEKKSIDRPCPHRGRYFEMFGRNWRLGRVCLLKWITLVPKQNDYW